MMIASTQLEMAFTTQRTLLSKSLAIAIVYCSCTTVIADQPKKSDSRAVIRKLEKLESEKAKYLELRKKEVARLAGRFDTAIELVNGSRELPANERVSISKELEQAKQEFLDDGQFARIPVIQPDYVAFVVATRTAFNGLMKSYDAVMKAIPKDDMRNKKLREEIEEFTRELEKYDTLKEGVTFVGYRMDHDWGAFTKVIRVGNAVNFQRLNNPPVNTEFTLRIDRRTGDRLEGTISQNGGQFEAIVEGTYDGVNIHIGMVRIVRGNKREFEYAGKIVGTFGKVDLRGIKANGVPTTGQILLMRQ